jgi:hypothetical protein
MKKDIIDAPKPKLIGLRIWPRAIPQVIVGHQDLLEAPPPPLNHHSYYNHHRFEFHVVDLSLVSGRGGRGQ